MKLFNVSWSEDGQWKSGMDNYKLVPADSKEEAKQKANSDPKNAVYQSRWYSCYCSEVKINGYVIEVYDETSYKRDKKIEKIINYK